MEELYLVCIDCGEAFHESVALTELVKHQDKHMVNHDWEGWEIQPESEAM